MIDDRFLPRVWTDEGYYYPIFSELGITYENKNLPFTEENLKDINWAFRWRFNHSNENVDMEYINTLEQCTGLKDKNGKLIYEGDIVRLTGVNKTTYDYAIKWDNGCYFLMKAISKYASTRPLSRIYLMPKEMYEEGLEVIGNIHENADLLDNEECYSD